jgi:manganese/zinc/iron transport system permease protein
VPQAIPISDLPDLGELFAVLTLRDYNTRVVVIGVSLLGLAAGVIGSFLLLRKRALLGDALSHATLPGIGVAFLLMSAAGGDGKWLPGLLAGASVSGALGVLCILAITRLSRIKEDAALGIVLSVFFGLGMVLLGIIQRQQTGNAAGLQSFIYGKTASMLLSDAWWIAGVAAAVSFLCVALFKEFALLCFDSGYARTQGWPAGWLDVALMAGVVAVTVIGLQAVGLILIIALLVIPAAAARFWTNHLPTMLAAAAAIGALSGYVGASISALTPRLPAGAVIVLMAGAIFGVSLLLGPARGVLVRWRENRRLTRRVRRQHLLRALHELTEEADLHSGGVVAIRQLREARAWSHAELERELVGASRDELIDRCGADGVALTPSGAAAAWRIVRNHRLWELFLITHADIAPSHVDRDADEVEHVLEPDMITELESLLAVRHPDLALPASPHRLVSGRTATRGPV